MKQENKKVLIVQYAWNYKTFFDKFPRSFPKQGPNFKVPKNNQP